MKHFTQFLHMLRAAWDGDRQKLAEQVLALADQMEGEGDAARARMLRFTLQSLQSQPPARDGHTLMKPANAATGRPTPPRPATDLDLGSPTVALTFGTWDETKH